jgi:hypothetical protein
MAGGSACSGGCSGGGSGGNSGSVADTESLRGGDDGTTIAGGAADTGYDLAPINTDAHAVRAWKR